MKLFFPALHTSRSTVLRWMDISGSLIGCLATSWQVMSNHSCVLPCYLCAHASSIFFWIFLQEILGFFLVCLFVFSHVPNIWSCSLLLSMSMFKRSIVLIILAPAGILGAMSKACQLKPYCSLALQLILQVSEMNVNRSHSSWDITEVLCGR